MNIQAPDIIKQFIVFCGVGSINTIFGLAIILFCSEILNINYIISNMIGYAAGLLLGFVLHRAITFKGQSDPNKSRSEFIKFITIFAVAYGVQLGGLVVMVRVIGIPEIAAQVLAIGIYTVLNYLGNRVFTFRSHQKETTS